MGLLTSLPSWLLLKLNKKNIIINIFEPQNESKTRLTPSTLLTCLLTTSTNLRSNPDHKLVENVLQHQDLFKPTKRWETSTFLPFTPRVDPKFINLQEFEMASWDQRIKRACWFPPALQRHLNLKKIYNILSNDDSCKTYISFFTYYSKNSHYASPKNTNSEICPSSKRT